MDESGSDTSVRSDSTSDDEYSVVDGQVVNVTVGQNFFEYTSPHEPVHVRVYKTATNTSQVKTENVDSERCKKWKLHVCLDGEGSTTQKKSKECMRNYLDRMRKRRRL